jgi:glycogen debranching enzyme
LEARTSQPAPDDETPPPDAQDWYEIAATASLHERRPRTLKHNDTFAVFDQSGDVLAFPGSPEGVYRHDTRFLSQFLLTMNGGARPILLSSSLRDDNSVLNCDLTNPDLPAAEGKAALQNDRIHIRRTRFINHESVFERLTVTNFDDNPQTVSLELRFASDFADLFEVRGAVRLKRGTTLLPEVGADQVVLAYEGLDSAVRRTSLFFDPAPARISADLATFRFDIAPRKTRTVTIQVACGTVDRALPLQTRLVRAYRDARSDLRKASARATSIVSSNEVFNQTVRRCIADTYMLLTDTPQGPYPYAGIPWYSTVFGRDALITALETLWLDPEIARGVLSFLAANQAHTLDPGADAEPGKILHEMRHGEMANLGEVPFGRYYGSIDSTPLFLTLAGAYLLRTDDLATIEALWPNFEAALKWIDDYGDRDGDGYVEYGRLAEDGLVNQGWKDSHDSIFHADGTQARGPIALAEVQAYVYAAWHAAAEMLERRGDPDRAAEYRERAADLAQRFDRDFFDEELGTYVLALDGQKQPCRVRSSNAGHVLLTGLALRERAPTVVATMMAAASFSGWGIRTIPMGESRYNPMSYHNGSIWPHDNALIAAGFARYGYPGEASLILEGLIAASTYVDLRRLPELFCGFERRPSNGPTFYPVSCIPQAWSAAAPLFVLQSTLGLSIDARARRIEFDQPALPTSIDELRLGKLRIGDAWVDLALRRSGAKVLVEVLAREGEIEVLSRL